MRFDYFDMLSGEPAYLQGVGHIRSPLLAELKPTSGVGYRAYNLYLNILSWDKSNFLKYGQMMKYSGAAKLDRGCFNTFDVVTLLPQTRELCRGVLSFFMLEDLIWDEKNRKFLAIAPDEQKNIVGEVDRDNFESVREIMLQFNYIGLDKEAGATVTHTSDKAKELWERSQAFLKQQAESASHEDKPEYHLSNIVSKVCSVHPSYNLLNIFDLTVFQLYDTFFQIGYMRSADLSARIFSNHGGEKFRFEDWLKPIIKTL